MSRKVHLGVKWQYEAALLSKPVDLSALVAMSKRHPEDFFQDNVLHIIVTSLLNSQDECKSDKDTKLDILGILANCALAKSDSSKQSLKTAIQSISEWFDNYLKQEEGDGSKEPELHKAMLLLLARVWDYTIKTEDVLDLTYGNRTLAIEIVVGLLEDGETYSTQVVQRRKPNEGQLAQWEHELICYRYEKELVLQFCRLVKGFTHPSTYFLAESRRIEPYNVDQFAIEMNRLMEISIRSRLLEKLAISLYDCLFDDNDSAYSVLEESDHLAVGCLDAFIMHLYFYSTERNDELRRHLLSDTLLIPRLILPYIETCVCESLLNSPSSSSSTSTASFDAMIRSVSSSLKVLILATFRPPQNKFIISLLKRLNPSTSLVSSKEFVTSNDGIFSLICLLNVNMNTLDPSVNEADDDDDDGLLSSISISLLDSLSSIYSQMTNDQQSRVRKYCLSRGSCLLPVSRDTPSYLILSSILFDGCGGQVDYMKNNNSSKEVEEEEEEDTASVRSDMKMSSAKTVVQQQQQQQQTKKSSTSSTSSDEKNQDTRYRLLGDLPSLRNDRRGEEIAVSVNLRLPQAASDEKKKKKKKKEMTSAPVMRAKGDDQDKEEEEDVPCEFKCAINGHLLRDPVQSPYGHYYERSTILLWLTSQGSVCPLTHQPLVASQLVTADDVRRRIMKWHIERTVGGVSKRSEDKEVDVVIGNNGKAGRDCNDDIYDF